MESDSTRSLVSFIKISLHLEKLRDARSVFRFLKFLFEVKRIQIISSVSQDTFSLITNISSRFFYFFYWFFDNLYIIAKLTDTFPNSNNGAWLTKDFFRQLSRTSWLIGLILFLIYCIKTLRKTYTDESDLKVAALNKMTVR